MSMSANCYENHGFVVYLDGGGGEFIKEFMKHVRDGAGSKEVDVDIVYYQKGSTKPTMEEDEEYPFGKWDDGGPGEFKAISMRCILPTTLLSD